MNSSEGGSKATCIPEIQPLLLLLLIQTFLPLALSLRLAFSMATLVSRLQGDTADPLNVLNPLLVAERDDDHRRITLAVEGIKRDESLARSLRDHDETVSNSIFTSTDEVSTSVKSLAEIMESFNVGTGA
ncbi:hypothetical protein PF001_g32978, partial [Phytophthora fragariae]